MVVPLTADGSRASVSALQSLDGNDDVSFQTFILPEDSCVQLVLKHLGRGVPESVVREELESLIILVQGVTQLRSGRRSQGTAKDGPPTAHFIVSVARGPEFSKVRCSPNSGSDGGVVGGSKWPAAMQALPALWPHAAQLRIRNHGAPHVGAPTSPVDALPRGNNLSAVAAGETTQRTTVAM